MTTLRTLTRNLLALAFISLPVAIAVGAVQQLIYPIEWSQGLRTESPYGERVLGLLFWYLVLVWPILIGGVFHQVVILLLSRRASDVALRLGSCATSPFVLVGFLLVDGSADALLSPRTVLPVVALLGTYCVLVLRFLTRKAGS